MYSSIRKKMCKCGCGKAPSMGYNGYRFSCAPIEVIEKVGTKKEVAERNWNKKVTLGRQLHDAQNEVIIPKGTNELQRWFEDKHREMAGFCKHCNGKTQKGYPNFRNSIAHILPKAYFKSVATHPLNWIELCFYNKSCHTNLDQMSLDLIELNCFDEVVQKFVAMYPSIAVNERRRIPQVLLNYIEVEK